MRILYLGLLASLVAACSSNTDTTTTIPNVPVNVQLDLRDQQNRALLFDNGVVSIPAGSANGQGGVKGIYVVRQNATSYVAFERNCPYQPLSACATVTLDKSGLYFSDSCCGSQFSLQGQVTGGPAPRSLRQYSTSLSGSLLTITN
jgi:Rieske Fe-S protein